MPPITHIFIFNILSAYRKEKHNYVVKPGDRIQYLVPHIIWYFPKALDRPIYA